MRTVGQARRSVTLGPAMSDGLDAVGRHLAVSAAGARDARVRLYTAIRAAVAGGMTKAAASRHTGVSRVTIDRILKAPTVGTGTDGARCDITTPTPTETTRGRMGS